MEKNRRRFFWWPWGQKKATLSGTECRQRSEQAISSRIWGSGWDSVVWTVACARVYRPRGRNLGRLGFWKRGGIPTRPWVVVKTERRCGAACRREKDPMVAPTDGERCMVAAWVEGCDCGQFLSLTAWGWRQIQHVMSNTQDVKNDQLQRFQVTATALVVHPESDARPPSYDDEQAEAKEKLYLESVESDKDPRRDAGPRGKDPGRGRHGQV